MKYTQLFFPVSLSLRGEQRHREVNNVPRDTQLVSHRADLNPNLAATTMVSEYTASFCQLLWLI